MKLNVFILLVIVSVVSADLYSIAVNVLGMDKLSKMEPSLACSGVDSVQGVEERNKFNETVRCAYSYLNGIPNSIPIETQFEAVLILAAKEDGPMQRLINKTRSQYKLDHYSLELFLNDTARALLDSASLYGFYKFAFFEEESYAMRRILRGRQVELAKVFNLYESHPVSKQFSFEYVVNQLINPNIKLFKCDAFITKFKSAIEGKDDDIFQNEFEMFNDLLFNWILNDSVLLQNIMSFLEESTPDVSFEFQFKESLFQLTAFHKYREYIDWLIGYLVYIRKADFDHIENTLKLLYGDIASTEWNFLFVFIFSKNLLKNTYWSLSAKRSQECFIDGVNENISYILDMFKSKNLADVATNLILQLNLVNLVEKTHVPSPYRDFSATERLIRQISDVNDVNIGAINEKVSSIVSDVGAEDAVVARKEIETFVKQNEWITE